MAQQTYRANLSAAIYPMALSRAGRSVIVPQLDQNYDRRLDPTGEQKTPGIPQAIYLENVLPTTEGYQSVGFKSEAPFPVSNARVARVEIRDPNIGLMTLFFVDASVNAYALIGGIWRNVSRAGPGAGVTFAAALDFSIATVRGKTYILNAGNLFEFNYASPFLELTWKDDTAGSGSFLTPTGVLLGTRAIASSYGYLVLLKWNPLTGKETFIVWSSTLDESDFTPSLVTGAGGGAVGFSEGWPRHLIGTPDGFRAYCDNIIEARYTGNARYPFKLTPVNTDAGPLTPRSIYGQNDMDTHLYVSLQRSILAVSGSGVQPLAPELTEFLERFKSKEDVFDYATNTFSAVLETDSPLNYVIDLYTYGERYVFISTGDEPSNDFAPVLYETCYVYDRLLKRYGRLKIRHTHVFEHQTSSGNTILFLDSVTGSVKSWHLDVEDTTVSHTAVLLLGRIQGVRSRRICLESLELESGAADSTSVVLYPSNNGYDLNTKVIPYFVTADSGPTNKKYLAHTDSGNLSILLKGKFDVSSLQIKFHLGGDS